MIATWTEEHIIFDGDEYFAELITAIDGAQDSVELETYIFEIDDLSGKIEAALIRAALRGVRVRLLVDGVGAATWVDLRGLYLQTQKVEVRVFHPVYKLAAVASWLWKKGLRFSTPDERRRILWRLNRRTHRKLTLVDRQTAWVGSLNISGHHCQSHAGPGAWRDTGARVQGPAIEDLGRAFDYAWVRSHTVDGKRKWRPTVLERLTQAKLQHSPLVRLNYTSRMRRRSLREFLIRLETAKRRIWLTTPYLAPTAAVLRSLGVAARNGADVRILVPRKSDVFFMPWIANAFYSPLLADGVRIYEYLPRFLHAKSVIVDDWAVVGTSNMNRRSLIHDLEVDVVLQHPNSLQDLSQEFLVDLRCSEEIKKPASLFRRLVGQLLSRLLRDII